MYIPGSAWTLKNMKKILLAFALLLLTACTAETIKTETAVTPEAATDNQALHSTLQAPAKVSIIKFFDYNCGHCRDTHFTVKNLKNQFGDKIEFELKHFPLSAETFLVAETAECAGRQGRFEEYHNLLMEENFRQYSPENLQKVAQAAGVDVKAFNTCATNGIGKSEVTADKDQAESLGVKGTPYFLINNSIPVPGAIPEQSFARLIQQVLDGEVQ